MKAIVKTIARCLYCAFVPEKTRHSLKSRWIHKLMELVGDRILSQELVTNFSTRHVMVLAPHMDDEVLGCGGTLRRHVLSGAPVTVVYMTDGCRGDPDLYLQNLPKAVVADRELALASKRKDEAARAAEIIGIQELIFLDNPDGQLEASPEVVARLRKILEEIRPTVVYLPTILDAHRDHWATNQVFYTATRDLFFSKDWRPTYRGYEVWSPLLPNRIVDISDVIEIKERAVKQFESQNSHTDFVRAVLALNAYRSLYYSQGRGYAEAFYESTPELYHLTFQRLFVGWIP